MALGEQDPTAGWLGKTVLDRDGAELGTCAGVLADDPAGAPRWIAVELGPGTTWVPGPGAVVSPGQVRVSASPAEVATAPLVTQDPPSQEEQAGLSRHYGVASAATGTGSGARRQLLLVAGVLAGAAAVAAAVLAGRQVRGRLVFAPPMRRLRPQWARAQRTTARQARARQVRAGLDLLLRGSAAVTSAAPAVLAPAVLAPAMDVARREATRAAGRAATAARHGAGWGQAAARAGAVAARRTGVRTAHFGGAAASVTALTTRSGLRNGKRVAQSMGAVPDKVSESSEELQERWRKAMGRTTTALALGVGYVLGSRAGRQRYEQLKQSAARLAQRPEVQQARDRAKAALSETVHKGTAQLSETAKHRATGVKAKLRSSATDAGLPSGTGGDPYPDQGN